MKHELILTRSRKDFNAVMQEGTIENDVTIYEDFEIKLLKVEWLMPYVVPSDKQK